MGERRQLVDLVRKQGVRVAEAARMFGVSRKTAHKWLSRAESRGTDDGLRNLSRARIHQQRFDETVLELLIELRRLHPTWGPRKLLDHARNEHPALPLPAASTLGEVLRREQLVRRRHRGQRAAVSPYQPGESVPTQPNDRWTIDYKGQFRLGNGTLCYPLTLRDAVSRVVLRIDAFDGVRSTDVINVLSSAFESYGLPLELHSDTGAPFGSSGLARLSPVSIFALKRGIRPVFNRPAKPQDNGAHERMHRDLKAETTRPPGHDLADQQRRFESFRTTFNEVRPHEALNGATPLSNWSPSSRRPGQLFDPSSYPKYWERRPVECGGFISFKGRRAFVSNALAKETVGLEPIDDGVWRVHFTSIAIGLLDERAANLKVVGVNRPTTGDAKAA